MCPTLRRFSINTKLVVLIHSVFILLAALLFGPAGLRAQGLIDLGALPANFYSSSSAWAINNDGLIVGTAYVSNITGVDTTYEYHAVRWQNEQISSVYTCSSTRGADNYFSDINSSGDASGTVNGDGFIGRKAARWRGGSIELIPPIPDCTYFSRGYGINDSGWVVGDYIDNTLPPIGSFRAFLWKDNSVIKLPPLDSKGKSLAKKINNNGIAVGYATPGESFSIWYGCAWFNGKAYMLMPPSPYERSFAFDINDSNVIVGISDHGEWSWDAVLTTWKVTIVNGTDLQISAPTAAPRDFTFRIFYEFSGTPVAINNMNTVVGSGVDTLTWSQGLFVYQNGALGRLGELVNVGGSGACSNDRGIDINDSGLTVGTMALTNPTAVHGFLLTPNYLSVNLPSENWLMTAGESNIISWMHLGVDTINIYYQIGESPVQYLIADHYLADANYFVWDVPDTLLSTKVKIRIEDVSSATYAESKTFRIKGYILTRLNDDGDYDRFRPDLDGWQVTNSGTEMWPFSWYYRFNYQYGKDPNTNVTYPGTPEYPFFGAGIKKFVDWPLFTETFGLDQCYIPDNDGNLQYRRAATDFWALNADTNFFGSCFGFAQSSLLAFDRKATFLSYFGLPDFGNLYDVPVSDSNRKVINRLYERQLADDENDYNAASLSRTAVNVLEDIKAMMLSDTDDHRSISIFSHHEPTGGHTVLPYRVIKAPDWPEVYRVYVYDSNNPGDTGIYITIGTVSNRWFFPVLNWSENTPGTLRLDQPASHYLEPPHIGLDAKSGSPLAADAKYIYPCMKMLYSDARDVLVQAVNPCWGHGGYAKLDTLDGFTTQGPSVFLPIIPATGGAHRPFGLYMYRPDCYYYNINLSLLRDSNVYISFVTDSIIWNYSRAHADSSQREALIYYESNLGQDLTIYYGDEGNRTVDISAILPGDDYEKALDITNVTIEPGNSITTSYLKEGDFVIRNNGDGFPTYCDLKLSQISTDGLSLFNFNDLLLDGGTTYIIHAPDWSNLDTSPLIIYVKDYYGTILDSLILNSQPTDVEGSVDPSIPHTFALSQNYPNPFNPATTIEYSLPSREPVCIEIFNILGQKVRTLVNETKAVGTYRTEWNGTDDFGKVVSAGVYLYRFQAGDFEQTKKMLLLK